ncbi:class I SAM-dependent methyltransferase [Gracilibacillus kekensis]|uniref:Methyltransferase domain-containing protein n=1 Tax=Gracilibacillus kekensis TaxID=1027249 RepID=A0A1M7IZW3_9BACI|nr:class I SAM-dependent methyltransferase [Gracilibacillus kekensis]SHM46208.1 Methyltransferase domain-containing protein [Gracilibacillus kekensis]
MKKTDYSAIADRYDHNQFRVDEIQHDKDLKNYLNNYHQQEYQVLDLSCGTGNYLVKQHHFLKDLPIKWFGLDASEEMLRIAKEKNGHVTFDHANAEKMPYHSEMFDFIINNYAFHHYLDKNQVIDEVYRIMKKEAVFKMHNIAIHQMPKWWVYHYFPSAYTEDAQRFLEKDMIYHELKTRGFEVKMHIHYRMEEIKVVDYLKLAENRDISVLTLISDQDYQEGLEKMKFDLNKNRGKTIINDFAEMFCLAGKY